MIFNKIQKNKGFTFTTNLVSGFTLVELMVATSLFTIIMLMGIGSLIVSSDSARAAQKLRIAVDNVNFAMESMTRELRTGSYFYCGDQMIPPYDDFNGDCLNGAPRDVITFDPQDVPGAPVRVGYYRNKRENNGPETHTLVRCENLTTNCSDIVSSNVDVKSLKFLVKGSELTDKTQPSVQIFMSGVVKVKNTEVPFSLQSMASQRSVEVELEN